MPPRRRPIRHLVPLFYIAALALAGCGGKSDGQSDSPLAAAFPEPSPAEMRADALRFEEVVALCMQESGWEYTPADPFAAAVSTSEDDDPATNPDYGTQFGYGVARRYQLFDWPSIDADGNFVDTASEGTDNPNSTYVQGLSEADRAEYDIALYGAEQSEMSLDADGNAIVVDLTWEQRGCTGRGEHEVYEGRAFFDDDFSSRYYELQDAVDSDPAIDEAEVAWSTCMYDHDDAYDFTGVTDAESYAEQLLYLARGLQPADVDQSTGELLDAPDGGITIPLDDGTWVGFAGDEQRLTEDEIDAAIADEVALWKVDRQCRDETGLTDLLRDREQQIADTLAQEFPQYAGGGDEDES